MELVPVSPTSVPPAPLPWAGSTDLLTPTLPADPRCCEIPNAGRDQRNCQLQGGSGRSEAAQQSYTWWDSCGGSHCPPGIGPSESHFLCLQLEPLQGRSGPQGLSSLQPSSILPLPWQHLATGAACATALGGGTSPWLSGSLHSLLPSRPSFTAHLSPVSWQEVLLLSAGESQHWGERPQDPRCTGRTIPGHSAPAAAIVRSKHQRRGRCGRAGDGPAESRWEHAYLHLPGEGRGGRREDSWLPVAPSFPLSRLGAQEGSLGKRHWGGWRVHSPALGCSLPSSASTVITVLSHHQVSSMTEKELPGRRPELPTAWTG